MLQIEQRLRQGFPYWFRGQHGRRQRFEAFPARDGRLRDVDGLIGVDLHRIRAKTPRRHPQRALAA